VTEVAYGLARGFEYLAIALAVGGVAFLLICWLSALGAAVGVGEGSRRAATAAFATRLRRVLWIAAGIGLVATAAQIVLEGAEAAGISGFSAITRTIVEETLETRFGTVWGLAFLAWLVIAAMTGLMGSFLNEQQGGSSRSPSVRSLVTLLMVVPLAYLVLCPALSGHGSSQSPVALNFTVNAIHVGAMAVWLGGLGTLLLVLPSATRSATTPADRGRMLAGPLARFSTLALAMVGDLFSTGYGRAVLAKFLLLLCVMAVAAYNRRSSVPRLNAIAERGESPGRPGILLRRALRAEVALLAVVIGVTAALAGYAPPVSAQSGPFAITTEVGPTTLEMDVDPARVGANSMHIYFFDAKTGAPYKQGKELTVTATLPDKGIGPLPLTVQSAGPGHYIVQGAVLNAPGDWEIDLTLLVSEFEQLEEAVKVPVG
jgi:copper transport protein